MKIDITPGDSASILALQGQLNAASAPELDKRLQALLDERPLPVILDLGRTSYVSSAGLRVLLAAAKRSGKEQRPLLLCSVNDSVMEVLALTGFNRVLNIQANRDAALAALET